MVLPLQALPDETPAQSRSGPERWRANLWNVAAYAAAAALSVVISVVVLELWKANLRVPLEHNGDVPVHDMVIKAVMERWWYFTNPRLGMPAVFEGHDFPFVLGDSFHLLVIKLMGLFTSNSALVMNLYFLLSFPLTTITTMLALRRLGCSRVSAAAAGVLYAFLPFHTQRQEVHIFLATYYSVPLLVLAVVWLGDQQSLLTRERRRRLLAALGICALVSATGLYPAFFGAMLLFAAGGIACLRYRSWRHALATLALLGTLAAGLGAAALPVLVYRYKHGPNEEIKKRPLRDSETYALKPTFLLLPIKGHRFEALNDLTKRPYDNVPLEGVTMALGAIGALGFIGLLGSIFVRDRTGPASVRDRLADATLVATMFATVGGLSYLFALVVTTQFRGHNRMSVQIGCLALFGVALALDRIRRRVGPRWHAAIAVAAVAFGVWDQTSKVHIRNYEGHAFGYKSDGDLVRHIEKTVPPGAMIFELPYRRFPEDGYELLRPYFHSSSLRWSFPTMVGRPTAQWQRAMSARQPADLIDGLVRAGFDGLVIFRPLQPGWFQIEAQLGQLLAQSPVVSADGGFAFYDLTARRRAATGK